MPPRFSRKTRIILLAYIELRRTFTLTILKNFEEFIVLAQIVLGKLNNIIIDSSHGTTDFEI